MLGACNPPSPTGRSSPRSGSARCLPCKRVVVQQSEGGVRIAAVDRSLRCRRWPTSISPRRPREVRERLRLALDAV
ncbi:MAG: hypothetical protein R2991_05185 [Thermoanaerobaculia bacterium]